MVREQTTEPIIIKVGGSLFDLSDLGPRLERWLDQFRNNSTNPLILVPGGGAAAEVIRQLDRCHGLGNERAHWLALRAMTINAHFLAGLLHNAAVVTSLHTCAARWRRGTLSVLDAHAFLANDEGQSGLPHGWEVSSDSVAARVARLAEARKLILLKSAALPAGITWDEAGTKGYVDPLFAKLVGRDLIVEAINLRDWSP
jgi:5-(aminomethyl)-3-furanmethanol phosphate kinase